MSLTKTYRTKKANLRERIYSLPGEVLRTLAMKVVSQNIPQSTYYAVVAGDSDNLEALTALSIVLDCTIDNLLDKNFQFDPKRVKSWEQIKPQLAN